MPNLYLDDNMQSLKTFSHNMLAGNIVPLNIF